MKIITYFVYNCVSEYGNAHMKLSLVELPLEETVPSIALPPDEARRKAYFIITGEYLPYDLSPKEIKEEVAKKFYSNESTWLEYIEVFKLCRDRKAEKNIANIPLYKIEVTIPNSVHPEDRNLLKAIRYFLRGQEDKLQGVYLPKISIIEKY